MNSLVFIDLVAGLAISGYAIYIEYQVDLDARFEAVCDVSEQVSCSKVLSSEYSKIWSAIGLVPKGSVLDQTNAIYGFIFYLIVGFVFWKLRHTQHGQLILLVLSTAAMVLSAALSYILTEILRTICLVCYATYLINGILFFSFAFSPPHESLTRKNKMQRHAF